MLSVYGFDFLCSHEFITFFLSSHFGVISGGRQSIICVQSASVTRILLGSLKMFTKTMGRMRSGEGKKQREKKTRWGKRDHGDQKGKPLSLGFFSLQSRINETLKHLLL